MDSPTSLTEMPPRSLWHRQAFYAAQIVANSLVGYLFTRVLAHRLGTSTSMSSFDIAFSVPFIIMTLSGFGFLYAVIAAAFSRMLTTRSSDLDSVFSSVLNLMWIMAGCLILATTLFSGPVTELLAPGLPVDAKEETRGLLLLMLPLVATLGTSTYFGGVFTAYNIPIPAEFTLLVSRLGSIIYVLVAARDFAPEQLAIALIVFSAMSLVLEWLILTRATGIRYRFVLALRHPELRRLASQTVGFMVVAIVAQVNWSYMRRLATLDDPGTVAALSYAYSLAAPLGTILGKSLAFATGPHLVGLYVNQQYRLARRAVTKQVALCLAITLLAVVALNANATLFTAMMYGGGAFDSAAIAVTAELARQALWSLPGLAVLWVTLIPLLGDSRSQAAAVIYILGYVVQFLLNVLLFPVMGRHILASGYSFAAAIQGLLGVAYVYYMLGNGRKTPSS